MLTEKRRKEIASLIQRKYRQRLGETLVEGIRSVKSAIAARAPLIDIVVVADRANDPDIMSLLEGIPAQVHLVDVRTMASMSDVETSQGILAVAKTKVKPLHTLLSHSTLLVLDGIQDPGNAGTLVRTAAWFGIGGIVTTPGTVDLFSPKVIRASMGAIWDINSGVTPSADTLAGALREAGFNLYVAEMSGSDSREWSHTRPCALILGSEAHGASEALVAVADEVIGIASPARGEVMESLNVAVAGSILLYEMTR